MSIHPELPNSATWYSSIYGEKSKGRPKKPVRYLTSPVEASHLAGADPCFHAKEVNSKWWFDGVWRVHWEKLKYIVVSTKFESLGVDA